MVTEKPCKAYLGLASDCVEHSRGDRIAEATWRAHERNIYIDAGLFVLVFS